nr:MAG TPA: hypothetical protein [Caudoviricetes sp.]DAV98346.1 MAG TPA: hypothetical protein [Caudoviricetes sp.]
MLVYPFANIARYYIYHNKQNEICQTHNEHPLSVARLGQSNERYYNI